MSNNKKEDIIASEWIKLIGESKYNLLPIDNEGFTTEAISFCEVDYSKYEIKFLYDELVFYRPLSLEDLI